MPSYKIESWNPIIPDKATFPFPMLYIKADSGLLSYAKKYNYNILVTIRNSNSTYDNKPIVGVLDSSNSFPNSERSNFYNRFGFYTITLVASWLGYPPNNGVADIDFINENNIPEPKFVPPEPIVYTEWYGSEPTVNPVMKGTQSLENETLTKIYISFIVLILTLMFFVKH